VVSLSYPAKYRFEVRQGSTFRRVFTWEVEGHPVDLTGWTARMQVRPTVDSQQVALEVTPYVNPGPDEEAGEIEFDIPASVLSEVPAGRYVYDLEMVDGDFVLALMAGPFIVRAEVTREAAELNGEDPVEE